jgi:hypothetical protein
MILKALLGASAAALVAVGAHAVQLETTPRVTMDPGAVLDDFHDAASKADFGRYFSHWTDQSVFLGTDAGERWVGEQFRAFAKPIFEKGKGWMYRAHDRHLSPVDAAAAETVLFDELLDNEKLGLCRGSGLLQRVGGEWKVMQYNLSIPIPNEKALEVAELIRAKPPAAAPATPPRVPAKPERPAGGR